MGKKGASTRRVIAMPDEIWLEVEAYRKREAIATTAETLRRMVVFAARALMKEEAKK